MNAFLWFLLPITFMVFIFGIDSLERKANADAGTDKVFRKKKKEEQNKVTIFKRNDWKEADNYERVNWNQ